MNIITRSISKVIKGAFKALERYPASILSALAFAVVTMVRIQLEWPAQEAYNFLFNCLHWSFALGAIFGMAAVTLAQSKFGHPKAFKLANLITILVVGVAFTALFVLGKTTPEVHSNTAYLTDLSVARVTTAMVLSILSFMLWAGKSHTKSDFSSALFMTEKAFFIALIYGVVMMAGTSAVAGAIQNLLYHNMSEKVYMYIATISGFLAFTIFAGYFPDFHKDVVDRHRETAQKQPQFVEVLFGYIMIPIMMALTLVLLMWAGQTIFTGKWPVFLELSSIATTYAIGGIWLHLMVTHHTTALANFYKRFYPMAALVILAFQAQALLIQLGKSGLKTTEYFFILLWMVTVISAILLIVLKDRAHTAIVLLICGASVISVLPAVGYHALPVTLQTDRLETLLVSEGMLKDDKLMSAATVPAQSKREAITDAVNFLASTRDAKLPAWFDKHLSEGDVFKSKLGFEQTWPKDADNGVHNTYLGLNLSQPSGSINISDYDWTLTLTDTYKPDVSSNILKTARGTYQFYWVIDAISGPPKLKVVLNDKVLMEESTKAYLDQLKLRHPLSENQPTHATAEEMSTKFENKDIKVLLVFNNISLNVDPQNDKINSWISPPTLYLHEK